MALKIAITSSSGVSVPSAYHRVENLYLDGKERIAFRLRTYVSHETTDLDALDERMFRCAYDLEGENPICQAYRHLKTLPDFEGATDC
ncbi:hypothetical protein J2T31_002138 [Kerstersia gyiorum]|nr:hypothetical protein [Kerstersia gyiorum]MCP1823909.1 hypothetical protein [Kerstersia gyiorum]MCP1827350.1 hypothetical protein [Kerstersia gyiorum]MCW2449001.1 hypothetical protein [Kerstersia gyiorum]